MDAVYRLLIAGDVMLNKDPSKDRERAIVSLKNLFNVLDINAAICDLEIPLTKRGYPSDKTYSLAGLSRRL